MANEQGDMIELPRGASDAALAPYHVDRSKIFVRERFVFNPLIDPDRLARNIELTRFPVPDDEDHAETDTEAAFVRAADLIGQLGDPLYPRKLNALFHEFEEIGVNKLLGYATPADVADHYPRFFWSKVEPFLGEAVQALNMTAEGRQWLANLYSHVCVIEHGRRAMGPNPARAAAKQGPRRARHHATGGLDTSPSCLHRSPRHTGAGRRNGNVAGDHSAWQQRASLRHGTKPPPEPHEVVVRPVT